MLRYLFDTNAVSFLIKERQPYLALRIEKVGIERIAISAITEAELLWGLAKKPQAPIIEQRIKLFLEQVEVLSWDRDAAKSYAQLKQKMQQQGFNLSPQDLLIAVHAYAFDITLITNDQAFFKLQPLLDVEDWTV